VVSWHEHPGRFKQLRNPKPKYECCNRRIMPVARGQHVEEKRLSETLHPLPPGDAYNLLGEVGSRSDTFCDESARRARRVAGKRSSSTKREVTFVLVLCLNTD